MTSTHTPCGDERVATLRELIQEIDRPLWRAAALARLDELETAQSAEGASLPGALWLAQWFHDTYERLAPQFGYETRLDTKRFDATTPNGRLMVAVCEELRKGLAQSASAPSAEALRIAQELEHSHVPPDNHARVMGAELIRIASIAPSAIAPITAKKFADMVILDVSEIPDRTSPDDFPEAMLVTGQELRGIIEKHFATSATAAPLTPEEVAHLFEVIEDSGVPLQPELWEKLEAMGKRAPADSTSKPPPSEQHFIAPRPLPLELAAVLVEYDQITDKADRGNPEWDFVMRAADYRLIREFFAKLKPGGAPTVITNPPKGWTP